ncbi:hypothetical protein TWF788_007881 [Orbilia oligospora]|uniref:F-box domain-containing protein n=1 Tax=Orbilia oligospora TaxID=2813651 RepID=A0A7C8PRK0_ORBOL|nr:hypothetical protein TWF788_007881 [Orbilia oligospora]
MATSVGGMAQVPPLNNDFKDKPTAVVESLLQGLSISNTNPKPSSLTLSSSRPARKETSVIIPYLPTEIIQEILFYLSPHDFDSARLVCRDWFQASSCRALLQRNIDALHSPSGATSRSNQWSAQQIQTFSVLHLRRYFTTLVTEWPGSRHRVPCLKTRLDARALLDVSNPTTSTSNNGNNSNTNTTTPNPDSNNYSPNESFECVGFSRQTGSFAAMVVGRRSSRKLYICRLFSKTHLTLEFRPHRHSCCPCIPEPGPLYMIFDVKTALNLRIVKVDMEEVESPSSVKELSITFENGIVETYTFEGLAPHRIYQLNIKDKTVKTAAIAHNHGPNQTCGNAQCKAGNGYALTNPRYPNPTGQPGNKIRGFFQGFLSRFHKHPSAGFPPGLGWQQQQARGNPAMLEVKAAMQSPDPKTMRVKILGREELCYVLSVPFDKQGSNLGVLAVSKSSGMVYVCGTSPELSQPKKGKDETTVYMHHWLSVPPRKNGRGEITHISVAPLMHYDVGQNDAYMGVLIGYANGEIWLWRMNREWRHLVPGCGQNKARGSDDGEQRKYPDRPVQTPCVSTAIPPPLEVPVIKGQEPSLPVLNIVAPEGQKVDVVDSNEKAWKLAYLPGLKALNFVARGVVILAADGKFVWGFDLRELHGFDKNTVHVPGGGVGLYGGTWGDGGEVSGFLNWGRG